MDELSRKLNKYFAGRVVRDEILNARKNFTRNEWIDVLMRSIGMEPTQLEQKVKWHFLARMIPFVENNYNLCELGPRGTGKSHLYKEISPNSILVSGGQTTVANLFYNMSTKEIGLVGLWDVIAVRKTVSGLVKLIYPDGEYGKDDIAEILRYALVGRRRVKEQLKKIGGMEFYDVHFSYIDNETLSEEFVSVPEQGGGKIIPEGIGKPGHIYTIARGRSGMIGVYKLETRVVSGSGKFERTGLGSDREAKEACDTAFRYFKANSRSISSCISTSTRDFLMDVQNINGVGLTGELALSAYVALCSASLGKPVMSQMVVLGSMSIGGTVNKVGELANVLQVCFDSGAKKILMPMSSATDIPSVPPELFAKFQISFYQSPEDAVYKALGVE